MDELFKHLINSRINESDLRDKVIPVLLEKGFKRVADLEFLEEDDLKEFRELPIRRRLWRFIRGDTSIAFTDGSGTNEVEDQEGGIYIRYILCGSDFFVADANEQLVKDISPSQLKLSDAVQLICSHNNIPPEETIELYSSHGYPLQNNTITGKATLKSWGISDGDLFYAIRRPKKQPESKEFVSLPELDHNIGQETFIIETPFHGSFRVNAYMDCDSPEDIAQKVFSVTGLQVPFMSLYLRRGYIHERMTAFTELKDRDHIRIVLRNPFEIIRPRSFSYGCKTYNALIPQTELGAIKFFSILKFICSSQPFNKSYDFEKLLSYLMSFTDFPPMVYALRSLKEFSFLSISGWTALIEGLYLLFKTMLHKFAKVNDDCVFEYSEYMWSILINKSHDVADTSNVETDLCSLVCPLSGTRIHIPVRIGEDMKQGPFDKDNIQAKITGMTTHPDLLSITQQDDNDFMQFGTVKPTMEQLKLDLETAKLLMYFPWETDKNVCVWTNPPKDVIPKVCRKVFISFEWLDMARSLRELCIVNPKGLYCGDECLTYNSKAHLIYFLGSAKSSDENRRFYHANAYGRAKDNYQEVIKKSELDRIGSLFLELLVTSDITQKLINPTDEIYKCNDIRKAAIIPFDASIKWETEEAIVVLFDHSYSMNDPVFPEMDDIRRIDAAKQLFNSFASRIQAYKLHHALGLTLFSTKITIKLAVTKNIEEFETSLKDVEPKNSTSLTEAIFNAVKQLENFNCRRRIVCLTDGFNNCSTSYQTALDSAKDARVVVDTVLLTGPRGNDEQKAFSHATGGVCVLPKTMQEALRYFELDAMLSLGERVCKDPTTSVCLKDYQDLSLYPYETETSFHSSYIESFHTVKTHSIKQHIDQQKDQTLSNSHQRRILKELKELLHNPHHYITVYPSQTDFEKWKVLICAPFLSAYSGGVYTLSVEFPKKYPLCPPEIRFLTRIYHCNISSSSGRICHAILGESYTPSISMRDILSYIYGLLMYPDMDTPLDSALAGEYGYLSDRDKGHTEYFNVAIEHFEKAKTAVKLYASTPFDELNKEFSGEL